MTLGDIERRDAVAQFFYPTSVRDVVPGAPYLRPNGLTYGDEIWYVNARGE